MGQCHSNATSPLTQCVDDGPALQSAIDAAQRQPQPLAMAMPICCPTHTHTHTHTRAPPMKPKVGGWQQIAIAISVDCSSCCAIVTGSEIRHATAIYSAGGNNLMWANGCRQRRSLFIPAGTYMISTPLIVHSNQNHSELVGGKDHHWHSLLLACQDSNVASVK